MNSQTVKRPNIIDSFLIGAREGWQIGITAMLPAVVMAFSIMQILLFTGVLEYIDIIFKPVMALFDLPGAAATPLVFSIVSITGALGMVASMAVSGTLSATHVAMMLPAIMLTGAQLVYLGRVLGVSGLKSKYYPIVFCIAYFDGILALILMKLIL